MKHLKAFIAWTQVYRIADTFLVYDVLVGIGRTVLSGLSIGFGFGLTFTLAGILGSVQERTTFPMILAEIESYRAYPDSVKCSPQVSNTIANLNARIVHEHEANRQWFLIDWMSTDRWNAVAPIDLYCNDAPRD